MLCRKSLIQTKETTKEITAFTTHIFVNVNTLLLSENGEMEMFQNKDTTVRVHFLIVF